VSQDNQLTNIMVHEQLHLCFIFQMSNICVVYFSYCNHFTWAKHTRGYTILKKWITKLNVMFNIIGYYHMLVIVVVNFIANKGGTNKSAMEFVISGDYLKLKIDVISLGCWTTPLVTCLQMHWISLDYLIHKEKV